MALVFTVEISLKRNPLPITVQRREQAEAETLLKTLGEAMTTRRSELLHLNCDASSERKVLLLSDEIASRHSGEGLCAHCWHHS